MDENNVAATGTEAVESAPVIPEEPVGPVGPVGETGEPGPPYDEDAIVPEGWKPEPEEKPEAEEGGASQGDENLLKLFSLKRPDSVEPTPESVPDSQPPKEAEPETAPKEDTEPDYKAMYEELSRSMQEAESRETFRQVYAEQKAAGMSDAAARLVAKDAAGGKEFPLTDEADASGNAGKSDYAVALSQLHSAFPDVKEIPTEVSKAIMSGGDPVTAYMGYQRAQDQKTIGELRAQIRDMEQKASNTVRAVARGVSGNGAKQEADDKFLKGMMEEDW